MYSIKLSAGAKINLSLEITGKRPDGMHDIVSLMHGVTLCDDVGIAAALSDTPSVKLDCVTDGGGAPDGIPVDENNMAHKAAAAFMRISGLTLETHIKIVKRIPPCAGLGGGSTDAAAVIRGLVSLFSDSLNNAELHNLLVSLGADVPFCYRGTPCVARGVGDVLGDAPGLPDCHIVIATNGSWLSTGEMYEKYDQSIDGGSGDILNKTEILLAAMETGSLDNIGENLYNCFENVAFIQRPKISRMKKRIANFGASGVLMTGSGNGIFGLFKRYEDAEKCFGDFTANGEAAYLCKPAAK